jgi:tRNA(Leu) C34 or U34 (ribose-2'-O)-methylase TrmL
VSAARGYFGIGVYGSKWEANIGTLWRHARLYNADFIFTIGKRYQTQPTDTSDAPKHTPLYEYTDWDDFKHHLPRGVEVILVEQTVDATLLPSFKHPQRAVYVLGAEDGGIPVDYLALHQAIKIPSGQPQSMNVANAGTLVMYDRYTKQIARRAAVL